MILNIEFTLNLVNLKTLYNLDVKRIEFGKNSFENYMDMDVI